MHRNPEAVSWAGLAVRVAAAGVWIAAGIAKLPQIASFPDLVERYGILPHFRASIS